MKITNTQVYGFEAAFRGMRNPMNSHHLSDSIDCGCTPCVECKFLKSEDCGKNLVDGAFIIGEKDLGLAQRLIKGGSEHCKFLRQIRVWADFDLPRYIWSELDTYHYNTKNSTSTMHRLLNNQNPITLDLFVSCEEDKEIMEMIIKRLEQMRQEYLQTKDIRLLVRAKRLLPEGFLQMRTMDTNYAELRNIYFQRRHHRLKEEWSDVFCAWVESLPYAAELITYECK